MPSYEGERVRCKVDFSFFFLMWSDQFTLVDGLSLLEAQVLFVHPPGVSQGPVPVCSPWVKLNNPPIQTQHDAPAQCKHRTGAGGTSEKKSVISQNAV